ncbi:MAG: hypothetical protein ACQESJ_03445 [Bacteroidota bacterium]
MEWGSNLKIDLELSNDSSYILDVDQLPHSDKDFGERLRRYTYYPATLSEDFIEQLKEIKIEEDKDTSMVQSFDKTLWSALHDFIGGEWPHFMNTILYAIEKGYLDLEAPLMKRPDTNWKPDPKTESYKRTRKWDYYVPVNQRHAHNEYELRKENDNLGGLKYVPESFIDLFLDAGNWKYSRMQKKDDKETERRLAKIDMVKLLLGSRYLGTPQIQYIKSGVLKAMNDYSKEELPSIIIFDNFNAAVAMSLNESGYKIDKVIFKDVDEISEEVKTERKDKIEAIVDNINEVNKEIFKKRLKKYYE